MNQKSEIQLACELVRILDGVPIYDADQALLRARHVLLKTQTVAARSPLLLALEETATALKTE
jgi:hypothetical protein